MTTIERQSVIYYSTCSNCINTHSDLAAFADINIPHLTTSEVHRLNLAIVNDYFECALLTGFVPGIWD